MLASERQKRRPTRHNMSTDIARHHDLDMSSPFTSGSMNNLAPAQFHGMYVRNPIRNQYRKFMKVKSAYQKRRS